MKSFITITNINITTTTTKAIARKRLRGEVRLPINMFLLTNLNTLN
jgi:hypothetical protein